MEKYVTNPQPSSNPLYKGVFSTRINSRHDSRYGYYLDKLYRVQFLGIGTHEATIDHDLIKAVRVRFVGLGDRVELFRAIPNKYNESLVLEGLGGTLIESKPTHILELLNHSIVRLGDLFSDLRFVLQIRSATPTYSGDFVAEYLDKLHNAGLLNIVDLKDALLKADVPVLMPYDEVSKKEAYFFTIHDAMKVKLAEELVQVILQDLSLKDNSVLVTDMEVFSRIVHKADVISKVLYLAEKAGCQAIKEALDVEGLSRKEVSLIHYLLFRDSEAYRSVVESAIEKYVFSRYTSKDYVIDVVNLISNEILENQGDVEYLMSAKSLVDAVINTSVQLDSVVSKANELLEKFFQRKVSDHRYARIDFDHELRADDSRELKAVLDALYEEFIRLTESADIVDRDISGDHIIVRDALVVEHLLNGKKGRDESKIEDTEYLARDSTVILTSVDTDLLAEKIIVKPGSVLDGDHHGELWSETALFVGDSRETELLGELVNTVTRLEFSPDYDFLFGELTSVEQPLTVYSEGELFGELVSAVHPLSFERETEWWGELVNKEQLNVSSYDSELFGELTNRLEPYQREFQVEITGVKLFNNESFTQKDYDIAVLSCSNQDLKYRRRPPLEPDKMPEDPLFEWVCTEGYVCDDWLIVPLKDFNFENPDQDGFYDPVTLEPYYPTGKYDEDGDPYVLPPYSVLNEPISNGADVGGKYPMAINPCNLYSFIEYIVKIYDAYKSRFKASSPIDTVSRVLNMLFDQVQTLIDEWDESKDYTPDELWRIYRFIRWMALGITHRFYRVKVKYTYGDFIERFEVYPFSPLITTMGTVRKNVPGYGWVLEGHPIIESQQNSATFEFKLPPKTRSSTITFDMGHVVPDRPDELVSGGVLFREDFEGLPSDFKITGYGWVPVTTQSGTGLGIEEPAKARTYVTSMVNVPNGAVNPSLSFNYGIDTNMETKLVLKKSSGEVVWQSSGVVPYGYAKINNIAPGDYYFEVRVPQAESNTMTYITFTAQQIQNEWEKVGYITQWRVEGDVIYEEENTPGIAMVVNTQWVEDNEYELEVEFYTEDIPSNYGLIDWIGVVLNYKDANNYYVFGTWSNLDPNAKGGLLKVSNGVMRGTPSKPTWQINPDFRFKLSHWHKLKAVVRGNRFTVYIDGTKYLDVTDHEGWGHGASGLMAYSNPMSSFRNFKYKSKPRFDAFIDNVVVESPSVYVPVQKPKYAIDFYLDNDNTPRIRDYSDTTKRTFSFPIMVGEHSAKWVFKKLSGERSIAQDASFIDNIIVKGMKPVGAEVVEEFIGCGGHMAVKLLIENLLEYYRRHHQGCKGERNIWIVE